MSIQDGAINVADELSELRRVLSTLERAQLLVRTRDGHIRYWSRGAERLYGWVRDEAIGQLSHVLLATRFPVDPAQIEDSLTQQQWWDGELLQRHKDGHQIAVASHWSLHCGVDGDISVIEVNNDISLRRNQDEARVYQSAIIESSLDAIIGTDLDGRVTTWNSGAELIFGYGAAEIVGRSITMLVPPDRLDEEERILERLRQGERIDHFETFRLRKDGSALPLSLTVSPIRAPDSTIIGASKIARDISDRKREQDKLAASQRRTEEALALLDTIQASAPIGFAFVDREFRAVRINEALAAISGLPAEAQLGRTIEEVVPGFWSQFERPCRAVLDTGRAQMNLEFIEQRQLSSLERDHRLVSFYPVRVANELIGVGIIVVDITAQRRSDEQLRQMQKMEAIGMLTGGLAHDFNNLLGVVIGNLDLVRPMVETDPPASELVSEALEAALRGASLTSHMLAFARRQPLRPRRIAVNDLVSANMRLMERVLGEKIVITLDLGNGLFPVVVDPAQLEAALVNLATNARDAMPRGGRLMIATANRDLDQDYAVEHPELCPGAYVMIEVSDTGTGIPEDVMTHIFEPFFTTKEVGKGSGLGLSMVFGFIKQSGGHVTAYSEIGRGTTFRLYLPRDESDAPGEVAPAVSPAPAGAGETILAVEDNAALRRILVRQLRQLGYRVIEADSAAAALAIVESEKIDLLLSDVVMPGEMDGVGLVRHVQAHHPAIRIILTSGFPENRIDGNPESLPSSIRLLTKPYRREELALVLRQVLSE